jgi:hypothetical protein
MRTSLYLFSFIFMSFGALAQKVVVPGSADIKTSHLNPGKSLYTIYYVKDTSWTKKGTFTHELSISGNELKLVSNYSDQNNKLYRKTISSADAKTLAPLAYKFEGPKNTFQLNFGDPIMGKFHFF